MGIEIDNNVESSIIKQIRDIHVPSDVENYPSLMSRDEVRLLYCLAMNNYSGVGTIVDAGIFFGASTYAFGKALQSRSDYNNLKSRKEKPIQSYEYGIWNKDMDRYLKKGKFRKLVGDRELKDGDSFIPVISDAIEGVKDVVDL
ncbi:MAG: hypothetical protein RLN96_09535, partial [Pseudomonadales bacterium]